MSKKITKKVYEARKEAIVSAIKATSAILDMLMAAGQYDSMNVFHDAERSLQDDLRFLEQDWNRRNWTQSDYSTYALVCDNVD